MGSQKLTSAPLGIARGKKKKGKEVRTKKTEEMSRPSHQAPIHRGSPGFKLTVAEEKPKNTSGAE
jgi:hypothetical protein